MTIHTHCALRLGDNLVHLHFLRKMAALYPEHSFVHGAHLCYLEQLSEVVWDVSNLRLIPIEYKDADSIDAWRGVDNFWYEHPLKLDFVAFHLEFFKRLTLKMLGTGADRGCPILTAADMLFDYPALKKGAKICEPFDCLIINSPPQSNQWQKYSEQEMTALVAVLARRMRVITTHQTRFPQIACTNDPKLRHTVTTIGSLSMHCKYIVMISTGPSWPTFNKWNVESVKRRVILIDNEEVNLAPNTVHCQRPDQAIKILQLEGIL